jgi:hypothetical protein
MVRVRDYKLFMLIYIMVVTTSPGAPVFGDKQFAYNLRVFSVGLTIVAMGT